MRILVTGANGYIGSHIVAGLLKAKHEVILAVRQSAQIQRQFPGSKIIVCDFNYDTDSAIWEPRLKDVDIVINCVGIFQKSYSQSINAIHVLTPQALFTACQKIGIKKIIHISALGADENVETLYAKTKKTTEDYLMQLNIDWIILRPSVVFGSGSSGSMSLFRGLAALPFILPIAGKGEQKLQPVFIEDLVQIVVQLLQPSAPSRLRLNVSGSQQITMHDFSIKLRKWLGFKTAKLFFIPISLMRIGAKLSDWLGIKAFNSTAFKMLFYDNTATLQDLQKLNQIFGFSPRSLEEGFLFEPSTMQDRWHARLYFLKPLLRLSFSLFWLINGLLILIALLCYPLLKDVGSNIDASFLVFYFFCLGLFNLFSGLAVLVNWRIRLVVSLQLILTLISTVFYGIMKPILWIISIYPFVSLLENIPLIVGMLILLALTEER